MKTYLTVLKSCLRNKLYWLGLAFVTSASIISATISEEQIPINYVKIFRLTPFFLTLIGIVIGNSVWGKLLFGAIDTTKKKVGIFWSIIWGIGIGFFVNSGIAELFNLSLQPSEVAYCWIIIGVIGLLVGSLYLSVINKTIQQSA
jgi:hypothetical protein